MASKKALGALGISLGTLLGVGAVMLSSHKIMHGSEATALVIAAPAIIASVTPSLEKDTIAQKQVLALTNRMDRLERTLQAGPAKTVTDDVATPKEFTAPVTAEEQNARETEAFEAELLREPPNLSIESEVKETLGASIAGGTMSGSEILQIRCGDTLCRIESMHSSKDAAERYAIAVNNLEGIGENGRGQLIEDEGHFRIIFYVSRGGVMLPKP